MCLGIPGQIVKVDDAARLLATADVSGVRRQVNLACVVDDGHAVESCIGDWVLIHAGFAMSRIDEAEARATMQILVELGEAQAEMDLMNREGSSDQLQPDGRDLVHTLLADDRGLGGVPQVVRGASRSGGAR
jgi:hydrogenase expression/formation protein HypC